MTWDLFLSHRSTERPEALRLRDLLVARGVRVWLDAERVDDFRPDIGGAIAHGLAACRALLALATHEWGKSRACQWELTAAAIGGAALGEGVTGRLLLVCPGGRGAVPAALHGARVWEGAVDDPLADAIVHHLGTLDGRTLGTRVPTTPRFDPPRFVGRGEELWTLHGLLEGRDTAMVTGRVAHDVGAVRAVGGMGKTMLAQEYAARFGAAWSEVVELNGRQGLTFQLLGVLARRGVAAPERPTGLPPDHAEALYLEALRGAVERALPARVLWLVDDLPEHPDPDDIELWRCPAAGSATLLTTRSARWAGRVATLDLEQLPRPASRELFWRRSSGDDSADDLLDALGDHALAVDVAGALAAQRGVAWVRERIHDAAHVDALAEALREDLPTGHARAIGATLAASFGLVDAAGWDLLRAASALAEGDIPVALLDAALGAVGWTEVEAVAGGESVCRDALGRLEDGVWTVHAVVRRTARVLDREPERVGRLVEGMEGWMVAELGPRARDPRRHAEVRPWLGHAEAVAKGRVGDVGAWAAVLHWAAGDYGRARGMQEELAEVRRRELGPEHPDTLTSMNNLAHTLRSQGDLSGARALHEEELSVCRRVLGPEHPDTLTSMSNLASTLRSQGDMSGARALEEEVLSVRRRVLGPEHPDTLTSMNNLAETLRSQGNLSGARALQEEVLSVCRRVLGPEHPNTLTSMNNLSETLRSQGDLSGARALHEGGLSVCRRVLGPEHPSTLTSMNNLAGTLRSQGDLSGARTLQEEVLSVRRRVLGPEHPSTLTSMNNLAGTLRSQGDLSGARTLQEEVLSVRRRVLGPEHPDTLVSAWNLFMTCHNLAVPTPPAALTLLDALAARAPSTLASADARTVRDRYLAARRH